jgi:ribosomal protein L12E/L44/L45/RPP1/RPP2
MEYIYATLLLHETGVDLTSDSLSRVLKSVDIDVDHRRMHQFLRQVEDTDLKEIEAEALGTEVTHEVETQYVYAALLLEEAGINLSPSTLAKVLQAANAQTTWDDIQSYASVLDEISIDEVVNDQTAVEASGSETPNSISASTTGEDTTQGYAPNQTPRILTRSEDVTVTGLNQSVAVKGKCDTGADMTSVDATLAGEVGLGPIKGKKLIRTASELVEVRVVAEAELAIGPFPAEKMDVVVADRSDGVHPVLIGWDFLKGKEVEIG